MNRIANTYKNSDPKELERVNNAANKGIYRLSTVVNEDIPVPKSKVLSLIMFYFSSEKEIVEKTEEFNFEFQKWNRLIVDVYKKVNLMFFWVSRRMTLS